MADPFPGYDVLDKHDTLSWNDKTRKVVDARLSLSESSGALDAVQLATLRRLVSRVAPQPERRAPANTLAIVLSRIAASTGNGFRPAGFPQFRKAWLRGLAAIEAEAQARHHQPFAELDDQAADALLDGISSGDVQSDSWGKLPPRQFWETRVLPDVLSAHWAHPSLWSAMGFGGPASPRGYVRLDADRRDGWEAREDARE